MARHGRAHDAEADESDFLLGCHVCVSDVADLRQVLRERVAEFALHALRVIDVVLHPQVGRADRLDQRQRLVGAREEEARNV
ncbi:Uncharacterised protein [Mycobacterium tuberculosis]|nr:Uncharacterised protein [Mycobacterium tuberculosis]